MRVTAGVRNLQLKKWTELLRRLLTLYVNKMKSSNTKQSSSNGDEVDAYGWNVAMDIKGVNNPENRDYS